MITSAISSQAPHLAPHEAPGRPGTLALELQALYEIARLIGSAINLDSTLSAILRILHEILRMERATLTLLDDAGKHLVIRASYGLTSEEARRGVYRLDEGVSGRIFRTGNPFVVPDVHSEPLFLNRTGSRHKIDRGRISFIGVPVIAGNQPAGVLTVDRLFGDEVNFQEDVRFLTVVAALTAQFLELHQAIVRKEATLIEENQSLKAELKSRYTFGRIIGQSKAMQVVYRVVEKVAVSNATVLLLGESGTGKELVAHAVHEASPRMAAPFVTVNCAALPETLLESELFGHERGAFTGANMMKKGRFELADGGTLFLDEIGEMPLTLQAKLLRVLQERTFERLGGTRTLTTNVRLIAATNRSLEDEVRNGTFRTDLYYRLNVVPVMLPPLRERQEDVTLLIDHFMKESNRRNKRQTRLSREVIDFMIKYPWPGNVRELQNLIERMVIMSDREWIRMGDLPSYMLAEPEKMIPTEVSRLAPAPGGAKPARSEAGAPAGMERMKPLRETEREQLEAALVRHGWVQSRAARELGLTQRQIGYKMKKFGLESPY